MQMPWTNGKSFTNTRLAPHAWSSDTVGEIAAPGIRGVLPATYPIIKISYAALLKRYPNAPENRSLPAQTPNDNLALSAPTAFRDIRYSPNRLAEHALLASHTPNQVVQSKD